MFEVGKRVKLVRRIGGYGFGESYCIEPGPAGIITEIHPGVQPGTNDYFAKIKFDEIQPHLADEPSWDNSVIVDEKDGGGLSASLDDFQLIGG